MHHVSLFCRFLLLPFLAFPAALCAAPYIEYIYPAGAQWGQTLEIALGGKSIDGAKEVWVSGEGVTGEVLEVTEPTEAQIREAKNRDEVASQRARLRINVAPGAAPGVRDLRIMARSGLSNRFRFEVGTLPEIKEVEPNDASQPQRLPALPVVVNGQILNADRDRFRFRASAGQQLLIQVKGRAIKPFLADAVPGWFQPKIALYDVRTGALLEEVDDFRFDPDPVLLWKVPASGEYDVEIWDAVSRGRDDLVYRMSIGQLPFVTDIFPLGGRAGAGSVEVQARGVNLPGNFSRFRVPVSGAEPGVIGVKPPFRFSPVNSRLFELGATPEVREQEPNNLLSEAQRVASPVTINGRIDRPGDVDLFEFTAKKGETFVLDVMARRLASPLDAKITVGPGKPFAAAAKITKRWQKLTSDDEKDERHGLITHHADPRLSVTFPADGIYQVEIQDTQGKGGPEYAYRLRIAPAQPDFELRIMPDNLSVPAGGNVIVQLKAFRIDGFRDAVNLHVEGLPPGCVLSGATIPAGKDSVIFTLSTPPDVKPGVYKPSFWADAKINGKTVRHPVHAAEELMQAFFYFHTIPVAQSYLIVGPPPPFSIEVVRPATGVFELEFGKEIEIPVRVIRREWTPEKVVSGKDAKGNVANAKKPTPKASQDPSTLPVFVTAIRGGNGVVVTGISVPPKEDVGVVKVRVENPRRIGTEGILIFEGTLRDRGKKMSILSPMIPYKVLPAKESTGKEETNATPAAPVLVVVPDVQQLVGIRSFQRLCFGSVLFFGGFRAGLDLLRQDA